MNRDSASPASLQPLLSAMLDGRLSELQIEELRDLLGNNPEAMRHYVRQIATHTMLEWIKGPPGFDVASGVSGRGSEGVVGSRWPVQQSAISNQPCPSPSSIHYPLSTTHYPLSTTHYPLSTAYSFVGGVLFSYLVAAVIVGIGLLIGAFTYVSQPTQVARQSAPVGASNPQSPIPNPSPKAPLVGRITGMVDCRWEGSVVSGQWSVVSGQKRSESKSTSHQPLATSHLVFLGDTFALTSGLLEITYNSGAKVILQGPVTYEVESASGGFLSLGKLTARVEGRGARVEKKVASGQWPLASKSEMSSLTTSHWPLATNTDPQSLIPNPSSLSTIHYPLFTVRTPTAVVTDLGTEFGVKVSKEGNTFSHVFRGTVEVQPSADGSKQGGQSIRLTENESVEVRKQPIGGKVTVYRVAANPASFVRAEQIPKLVEEQRLRPLRRWQTHSRQLRSDPTLLAYYTFESAGANNATLPNLSVAGSALDGRVEGAEWVYGRLPGKYALYFHGPGSGDRVVLPEPNRFNFAGPFSVAVWFNVRQFKMPYQAIVVKGEEPWRLQRNNETQSLEFGTNTGPYLASKTYTVFGRADIAPGQWHLAVVVCEPGKGSAHKRLYVDGRLDAEDDAPLPLTQDDKPLLLGGSGERPDRELLGLIDEVAVFSRPLSAEEVAAMYEAGIPANTAPGAAVELPPQQGDTSKQGN